MYLIDVLQRCPGELPGETTPPALPAHPGWSRFNDAPANCRGRRNGAGAGLDGIFVASTMPRRIAGGDNRAGDGVAGVVGASTMPRRIAGGDSKWSRACAICGRLQRCPGELPGETSRGMAEGVAGRVASTMPRRIAGGDSASSCTIQRVGRVGASTMPRRIAGGDSMAPTHCLPMRDSTNCERCRNIAWPAARATGSGLQIVKEHDALQ